MTGINAKRRHLPTDCTTREDVRFEIDRLDSQLVALMAERWQYVDRMSELKTRVEEANAPERVQQVLDNVVAQASASSFPPELARTIWQSIIDFAIAHEEEKIKARQS